MFAIVGLSHLQDSGIRDEFNIVLRRSFPDLAVPLDMVHPKLLHALNAYFGEPTVEPIEYMIDRVEIDGELFAGEPRLRLRLRNIAPSVLDRRAPGYRHLAALRLAEKYGVTAEIGDWLAHAIDPIEIKRLP